MTRRPPLVIRALGGDDEREALTAHDELVAECSMFLLGWEPDDSWAAYLRRLDSYRTGADLPAGHVPFTLLVGVVDEEPVGMLVVRHRLSPRLERMGGHLGYAVRPAHRLRGYATELMRHGMTLAGELGIDPVLVTCSDDNAPSISIIERAGGVLRDRVEAPGCGIKRRYLVPGRPE